MAAARRTLSDRTDHDKDESARGAESIDGAAAMAVRQCASPARGRVAVRSGALLPDQEQQSQQAERGDCQSDGRAIQRCGGGCTHRSGFRVGVVGWSTSALDGRWQGRVLRVDSCRSRSGCSEGPCGRAQLRAPTRPWPYFGSAFAHLAGRVLAPLAAGLRPRRWASRFARP